MIEPIEERQISVARQRVDDCLSCRCTLGLEPDEKPLRNLGIDIERLDVVGEELDEHIEVTGRTENLP
jgi:hypothetical protein